MSRLTDFLAGAGTDTQGRAHADIMAMDDEELERHHDYIQWLFPLPETSRAVPNAPVMSVGELEQLRASSAARGRVQEAAKRMLRFFRDNAHWLVPYNHNHLRISRIIRSLRLVEGDEAADAFRAEILARVRAARAPISDSALDHWDEA